MSRNADVGAAVARVEEARALSRLTRAQQMPLATLSLSTGRSRILVLADGSTAIGIAAGGCLLRFGFLWPSAVGHRKCTCRRTGSATARDSVALATAIRPLRAIYRSWDWTRGCYDVCNIGLTAEALRVARARRGGIHLAARAASSRVGIPSDRATRTGRRTGGIASGERVEYPGSEPPGDIKRGVEFSALVTPVIPEGLPSTLLSRRPTWFPPGRPSWHLSAPWIPRVRPSSPTSR